jgi:hypothetical protein
VLVRKSAIRRDTVHVRELEALALVGASSARHETPGVAS